MTQPDAYAADADDPHISRRSRGVGLALGLVGGIFGLHRFYVGKPTTGLLMICTVGGLGFWWLYDMVLLAGGEFRDADDLPLKRWAADDLPGYAGTAERRVAELEERLEALRGQFNELAERVDFAERMLAQHRDRPSLPRG